jgi:hypothetical protein
MFCGDTHYITHQPFYFLAIKEFYPLLVKFVFKYFYFELRLNSFSPSHRLGNLFKNASLNIISESNGHNSGLYKALRSI